MKLTRVTISGADDAVDPDALVALSVRFPFVEWGLLLSSKRAGTPRYPSDKWKMMIGFAVGFHLERQERSTGTVPRPINFSAHLCGGIARTVLDGSCPPLPTGGFWSRFQVNGFSQHLPPAEGFRDWTVRQVPTEVILQVQNEEALGVAHEMADRSPAFVTALWDISGGEGITPHRWPAPPSGLRLGYAGGIGPDNVAATLEMLAAFPVESEFWIDMESGVRTDDRFDLEKVRRVLESAEPFVTEGK